MRPPGRTTFDYWRPFGESTGTVWSPRATPSSADGSTRSVPAWTRCTRTALPGWTPWVSSGRPPRPAGRRATTSSSCSNACAATVGCLMLGPGSE
eukprot:scaffold239773_cov47-Prasinocladus_malaysianus.AAC.1